MPARRVGLALAALLASTGMVACSDPSPTTPSPDVTPPPATTSGASVDTTGPTPSSTTLTPRPSPDLDDWIGSDDARALAVTLRNVVLHQTGCETREDLDALESQARFVPEEIRDPLFAALAALQRSAAACDADILTWQQNLEDGLGHLDEITTILDSGAGAPASTAPLLEGTSPAMGPPSLDSLIATARLAVSRFGALHSGILGGADVSRNPQWISKNHEGRFGDLANAAADGGYDVVIVGSSLVVAGIDPVRMTEVDGRRTFNAGLPRITPEQLTIWLNSVTRLAQPDLVLYGTETRDVRILGDDRDSCGADVDEWVFAEELSTHAFAAVDVYAGLQWENLMFGWPVRFEPDPGYRSAVNEFGGKVAWTTTTEADLERSVRRSSWEGPYPLCVPRIGAVAANVAKLKEQGIAVVVVLMPVAELRVAQFAGGRPEISEILALMEAAVTEAGADAVFDLTDLLETPHFRDHIHANEEGRRVVTDELAARLASLGI